MHKLKYNKQSYNTLHIRYQPYMSWHQSTTLREFIKKEDPKSNMYFMC